MNGLLSEIGKKFEKSVSNLQKMVLRDVDFRSCQSSFHHWTDIPLLKLFNQTNQYSVDEVCHKIYPPEGVHYLLHWRVLALLIKKTEAGDNLVPFEKECNLHPRKVIFKKVNFIDSHFHLDMFLKRVPKFLWKEDEDVELQHLISNYCFPHNWPSSATRQEIRKDPRFKMTFGIHPRIINLESHRQIKNWMSDLEVLLEAREVVALGEYGLDEQIHTSKKDLDDQMQVLEWQPQLAKAKKLPVVIHCRGNRRINDICLKALENVLSTDHHIHRHCFEGSIDTYQKWKRAFPNCKFGIAPLLFKEKKYPNLRATVCEMDLNDILIETDAPYLSKDRKNKGSPALVFDIALSLAGMFKKPLAEIAKVTTSNVLKLYRI